MKSLIVPSVVVLLCLSTVPVHAQERGQTGITMALPASIGFIWHASDNIAVRPELSFSFGSSSIETPFDTEIESSGNSFSIGTSVLFYTGGTDSVRTYIAPRVAYSRTSYGVEGNDESADGFAVSGSFGAQYTPVPRFSVYGEVGLEYGRRSLSVDLGGFGAESRSSDLSTRGSVGVILYLGGT